MTRGGGVGSCENKPAELTAREEHLQRTAALSQIIHPLRTAAYEVDYPFSGVERMLQDFAKDWGGVELNPDFQRGHVWASEQQQHYIENILRGVVSSSGLLVQFNCPNWNDRGYAGDLPRGMQCIDGLQRLTAVRKFLAGEVRPFGLQVRDLDRSFFSMTGLTYRFRVAIHDFRSRKDLLQHYLDLNAGGIPHSKEELERVRKLRDAAADGAIARSGGNDSE